MHSSYLITLLDCLFAEAKERSVRGLEANSFLTTTNAALESGESTSAVQESADELDLSNASNFDGMYLSPYGR